MKNTESLIDEALKAEPPFQLRKDFKEKVVKAIQRKERAGQQKIYLWMALGTIAIVGLGFGIVSYFTPSLLEQLKNTGNNTNQIIKAKEQTKLVAQAIAACEALRK
ncbi:MAG: hypothetical protein AAFY41_02705 [Bacteroidota bacterium]